MDDFSVYARTGPSGLTTLRVINTADAEFGGDVRQQAGILPPVCFLIQLWLAYIFGFEALTEVN